VAPEYAHFDACRRFGYAADVPERPTECLSGEVLRGLRKPVDCPAFGTRCTPERPLGATMVSSEGACAAYYRYRRPVEEPV
jgi:hydrogenase expression/formation protein HypD